METWKKNAILMAVGRFSDSADTQVLLYVIPLVIKLWHIDPLAVGLVGTAGSLGALLGSFFSGWVIDRIGRRNGFVIGNGFGGVIYLVAAAATSWDQLIVARFLMGLSVNMTILSFFAWLPDDVPAEKRGSVAGLTNIVSMCGTLSVPGLLAATAFLPWLSYQHFLIYVGAVDILSAILGLMFMKEPEEWKKSMEARKREKRAYSYVALVSTPERRKAFFIGLPIIALYGAYGLAQTASTFNTYFQSTVLKLSPSLVGTLGMVSTLVGTLIMTIMSAYSDRIGRLNLMILGSAVGAIGTLLCWHTPLLVGVGENFGVIAFYMVTLFLASLLTGGTENVNRLWFSELYPPEARGSAQGITGVVKSVMMSVGQTAIPFLVVPFSITGYALVPFVCAVVGLICCIGAKKAGFETIKRMRSVLKEKV